ncbi:MAG: hypothetical protein QM723_23810 [Myxococcaceae bacterium]
MNKLSWGFFKERNFTVDTRTLGLFRIGFGLLLLTNLWDRCGGFDLITFYTNEGMLPNHYALFRPQAPGMWGLLFGFSSVNEVRAAVACIALVYLLYTLGLFTRTMQVLALVCAESVNWRFILPQHGGAVTTLILVVWTVFLPLGERLSLDAVIRAMRNHRQSDEKSLEKRGWRSVPAVSNTSLAFFGLCFNWAWIYFFNAYHKQGATWHSGNAVHYVLWINLRATELAVWLRNHEPFWFSPMSTWGTLVMEWALPVLILTPVFQKWAHRVGILFVFALHGTIALLVTLGPFSYSMMAFSLLLVHKDDWELLAKKLHRKSLERTVRYDPKNPRQAFAARVLARLDGLDHLTFKEHSGEFEVAKAGEKAVQGMSALASVTKALPLGPAYAWVFVVPVLNDLLRTLLRFTTSWLLELPVREVEEKPEGTIHRTVRLAVQLVLPAWLLVAVCSQLLVESWGVPARWKPSSRPVALTAVIDYLQVFQGWSMFAPDVPRGDSRMVVDATLADGTHLDPLTGELPDLDAPLHGPWGFNQHWGEVNARMRGWPEHWKNFRDYIFRIPRLKGWPANKNIVRFDVWWVSETTPEPGVYVEQNITKEKLFDSNI